jgi:hypothetical protein
MRGTPLIFVAGEIREVSRLGTRGESNPTLTIIQTATLSCNELLVAQRGTFSTPKIPLSRVGPHDIFRHASRVPLYRLSQ